jgi:UDPglucose 6-dehydrogenase
VLGLAFKPETDDMREAPSLPLVAGLVEAGAQVAAFDPVAMAGAKAMLPAGVEFAADVSAALTGADAVVLVTEWNEFRSLAAGKFSQLMRGKVVVDLRNVFDPVAMREAGFAYHGIGRKHDSR